MAELIGTNATAHGLAQHVVVGAFGVALVLVGAQLALHEVHQAVVGVGFARSRDERHADSAVDDVFDDALHRKLDLVELHLRAAKQLLRQRALPLRAWHAAEAPVLQALHALVAQGRLHLVKLLEGLGVDALMSGLL